MTSASELAQRLVRRLLALGVTEAVISPGSRSGPVARALCAAEEAGLLRLHVRVDEREAAFLALGMAKASGQCTPIVTTSGTAVANLHPAMLEAAHAGVELVAVTADRPGRLRGTGANQTTDQRRIFPSVHFVESIENLVPADGPTHLNLELDEPLTESVEWYFGLDSPTRSARGRCPQRWATRPPEEPEQRAGRVVRVAGVSRPVGPGPRTVVVAGDGAGPEARRVAEAGRWPLLAEPSSGARSGLALTSPRLVLEHSGLSAEIERVISFGHATLSRSVVSLLANAPETIHIGTQATFPVRAGDNVTLVDAVEVSAPDESAWMGRWQEADAAVTEAIAAIEDDRLAAARAVWGAVAPHETLWLGSSNPIRDVDLLAAPFAPGERRKVLANRGLAGIDGTVSSAIGAALVRGRTLAYVGDLTFLHGSNGMLIGPGEPRPDLTIVVANDDGGGIFAGLEQGAMEFADSFERVFATPTGADLGHLCAAYGIGYMRCKAGDLGASLQAARPAGITVVEVPVERRDRREFAAAVADAARGALRPR